MKCEEGDTLVHLLLTNQMITVKIRSSKIKIFHILYHSTIVINHRYHWHSQRELTQIIFSINESLYNFLLHPKHIL
jgi:hypothetical protein